MPRLTTLHYNNENLSFKYDISIDKQGHFTTALPEDVVEKLKNINVKLNTNSRGRRKEGFFSATSLNELKLKVEETADKYSKKKLVSEKIIIKYAVDTRCTYCRGISGKIYPNGGWESEAEGHENSYHWIQGTQDLHATKRGPFGFDVTFEVVKVRTWEFPNKEQTKEYERLNDSDTKDDEILQWLTSLTGMDFSSDSTIKEMDYTTEIGILFKNMVLFIININEKIHSIFGGNFDLSKIEPLKLMEGTKLFEKGEKK